MVEDDMSEGELMIEEFRLNVRPYREIEVCVKPGENPVKMDWDCFVLDFVNKSVILSDEVRISFEEVQRVSDDTIWFKKRIESVRFLYKDIEAERRNESGWNTL